MSEGWVIGPPDQFELGMEFVFVEGYAPYPYEDYEGVLHVGSVTRGDDRDGRCVGLLYGYDGHIERRGVFARGDDRNLLPLVARWRWFQHVETP